MNPNPPQKSASFPSNGDVNNNVQDNAAASAGSESEATSEGQQSSQCQLKPSCAAAPELRLSHSQALEDVYRFIHALSSSATKDTSSNPLQVPTSLESLLNMTEETIASYDSSNTKFGQNPDDDSSFLRSLNCMSTLLNITTSNSPIPSSLHRTSTLLHLSISFLDTEFRAILHTPNPDKPNTNADPKTPRASKQPSFISDTASEPDYAPQDEGYFPESISNMNRIATAMISSGYGEECCMVYNMVRRNALNRQLEKLGFNNISIDDVQRMQWESLEGEIATWITVVKHCSSLLLPAERNLSDSVFSEFPSISRSLFSDISLAVTLRFLNFSEAIALTKRSAEKLFKFLDMYETLRDLIPAIDDTYSDESAEKLKSEIWTAICRVGEAAVSIFCDLENSIKRDNGKTPVPSGAVHPLTRYTMNYLKYACEYKHTLEQVFQQHHKLDGHLYTPELEMEIKEGANEDGTPKTSPFSVQLNTVMDLLDENLDMKSKLYRDQALGYVFLMNNGRYILQKIKGSTEIYDMMGATWCRKRSSDMRQYHKGYTRETWSKLLQCVSHEGLQVNGKVSKVVLKERLKMFNAMFEEIHRTQSTWVVSDEQLQSELRVSVSAVVIPAYRSFLGRFQHYLASGRQVEKYVKYQPEDIESLIEELFDGNPTSMARRRTS